MKNNIKIIAQVTIIYTLLFISCSKQNENILSKGSGVVKIKFDGVESVLSTTNKQASAKLVAGDEPLSQILTVPFGEDLQVVATLTPIGLASKNNKVASVAASKPKDLADGTEYIIAIYQNDGTYVDIFKGTYKDSSEPLALELPAGTYKILAIASGINSLPMIDFTENLNKINFVEVQSDLDLMHKVLNVEVKADIVNNVSFILNHLFTEVNVSLNTSLIGSVTSFGTGSISPHAAKANVALATGVVSSYAGFGNKLFYLNGAGTKYLSSNPIMMLIDNTTSGVLTLNNVTINGKTKTISISNLNLAKGIKYNLELTLNTPAIQPIDLGGSILWAPGNLVLSNNVYSFAVNQGLPGNLWRVNSLQVYPYGGQQEYIKSLDPCTKVTQFGGGWRTPTSAELLSQTGSSETAFKARNFHIIYSSQVLRAAYDVNGAKVNGLYLGTTSQPSVANQDKYVFLPYGGINGSEVGTAASYWSVTPALANNERLYFNTGNVTLPLTSTYFTEGNSIRCVRSK